MATLTAKKRNAMPMGEFGLPGQRAYPMPDMSHARNAKARASQQYNAGRLSGSQKAAIDSKANRMLGKKSAKKAKRK